MRILALEPYYGGSHKAFIDGWMKRSRHSWELFGLEPYKWKWRMRHSAVTFAEKVGELSASDFDVIFCSDMLNVAEFNGLVDLEWRRLPKIVYFHENQLTYPVRFESERDYQFVFTNLTTALSADGVWFNSGFHRDEFLGELVKFLKRMPDYQPVGQVEKIREKSKVCWLGVEDDFGELQRENSAVTILWVGRWEHDKRPEDFFEALKEVKKRVGDFKINVIGEQFRDQPEVFDWAREYFSDHIGFWGYQESRGDYLRALSESDIVVSTAGHEFFGIAVVEAILAGAYPVLPKRLAYPEVLGLGVNEGVDEFFYDGGVKGLAERLVDLVSRKNREAIFGGDTQKAIRLAEKFKWENRVQKLDDEVEKLVSERV